MAETATTNLPGPDELVYPGDLVELYYAPKANATSDQVNAALSAIKKELSADEGYNYQGSEWREVNGQRLFVIQLQRRSYPKAADPQIYEANPLGFVAVLGTIIALALAATYAWGKYVDYQAAVVKKSTAATVQAIAENPNLTPEQKATALEAIGAGQQKLAQANLSLLAGGVFVAIIVIAVLWVSTSRHRGDY
jgi:hypothetical protein